MITTTFFHLFSRISLTSRKYFVLISLFCLLSNFLVLSVRSKGLSDRLIKMAGKRVWERKKRRDEYEFSDFVCNILDSLRGDGKLTNTYEKNTTIYLFSYFYSFDLQPPWTKTIFFLYTLLRHGFCSKSEDLERNRVNNYYFVSFFILDGCSLK